MVVLDWIMVALIGGFVVSAAAAASVVDRRRARAAVFARTPAARGLWSMAEAVWVGAGPPRRLRSPAGRLLHGRLGVRPLRDACPQGETTRLHVASRRFDIRHRE